MIALTPDRHAEVDALLSEMEKYLTALALELDIQGRNRDGRGSSYQAALHAAGQVAHLRSQLKSDQEQQGNHQPEQRKRARKHVQS